MMLFALVVALLVGFAAGIVWEGARTGGTVDWEARCWNAEGRAADARAEARQLHERIGAARRLCDRAEYSADGAVRAAGREVREALRGPVSSPLSPEAVQRHAEATS